MEFNDLIKVITDSSVVVVMLGYFIFRDYKFMTKLEVNIQKLIDVVMYSHGEIENVKKEVIDYGTKSRQSRS